MQYVTKCAILIKGDRIPRGATVELDAELAKIHGDEIVPVAGKTPEPAPEPEKAIEDMSVQELKEKAISLGLKGTGSKADLIERLTLHNGETEES